MWPIPEVGLDHQDFDAGHPGRPTGEVTTLLRSIYKDQLGVGPRHRQNQPGKAQTAPEVETSHGRIRPSGDVGQGIGQVSLVYSLCFAGTETAAGDPLDAQPVTQPLHLALL